MLPLRIPPAPPNPYNDNRKNTEYNPHERWRPDWCTHGHRQQRSDGRNAEQHESAPPRPRAAAPYPRREHECTNCVDEIPMPPLQSDPLLITQFWLDEFRERRDHTGSGQKERHTFEHHRHSSYFKNFLPRLRSNTGNIERPPNHA